MSWSGDRAWPRWTWSGDRVWSRWAWPRRCAALAGGVALSLIVLAPPAAAHAVLVSSEPAAGAAVASAPRTVQLRFSEDVTPRFSAARLVDQAGRPVGGTHVAATGGDPRLLVLELPPLGAGAYGVLWQVLAEVDGHTTSGAVVFTVGDGSGSSAAGSGRPVLARAAAAGGGGGARPADVALRWAGVSLLAGLIGALAVAGLVLGRVASARPSEPLVVAIRTARRRVLALAVACAVLGAVAGVIAAVVEAARQAPATGGSRATAIQLLATTRWGHLWLARESALLVLAVVTLRLRSTIGQPPRRGARALATTAGALVLALVSAEALGSHAAALDQTRAVAVAVDALHILTACLWLGALPALVLMTWPQPWGAAGPADLLIASRGHLTRLAAASVGLVVVTGLYSAGRQVDTVDALLGTAYGRTLLVKSTLLLVVGGLGLVNSARLHGRLPAWLGTVGGRLAARWPSRRLLLAEAGAGALLLLAVGVLLETAPARGPARVAAPATPTAVESASGSVADLVVTVSATPNRPGVNGFTALVASSRRPPPAPVGGVAIELTGAGATSTLALQQVAPGRWFGTGRLDQGGSLRLKAIIRRAGKRLAVPISWWVAPPVQAQRVPAAAGRRLAPYVDGLALSLLAGALAVAAGRLLLARRRRRPVEVAHPSQPPERAVEVAHSGQPPERVVGEMR